MKKTIFKSYCSTYLNKSTKEFALKNYLAALHRQLQALSESKRVTNSIPFPNWHSRYGPLFEIPHLNYLKWQLQLINSTYYYYCLPVTTLSGYCHFLKWSLFANAYEVEKPKTGKKYFWSFNILVYLFVSQDEWTETSWCHTAQRSLLNLEQCEINLEQYERCVAV